ncbi:MAG: hemerythrin domain-containing protein [Candidatus Eremiobacteraeota bacterium]|nr:hemerythrin domain-containing protein [Candidatus Eremiobacteraeota bacterium]
MDALELLKADHDKVRGLFKQVEGLGDRATTSRRDLFDQIDEELTLHSKIEEKLLYPQFKERAKDSEQKDEVLEAYEEHAVAKRLMKELEGIEPTDERYKAKLQVLIEGVKHHADEEEKELFPMARELFKPDELKEMGAQIVDMKEKAGAPVPQGARQ